MSSKIVATAGIAGRETHFYTLTCGTETHTINDPATGLTGIRRDVYIVEMWHMSDLDNRDAHPVLTFRTGNYDEARNAPQEFAEFFGHFILTTDEDDDE